MCKAMMEIIEESKEEGREEGIGIGRQEERDFILNSLIAGYQSGAIKLNFAAQLASMSEEEFLEKTHIS